jgi:hypothetical protein
LGDMELLLTIFAAPPPPPKDADLTRNDGA